jgi:hypothetical protein
MSARWPEPEAEFGVPGGIWADKGLSCAAHQVCSQARLNSGAERMMRRDRKAVRRRWFDRMTSPCSKPGRLVTRADFATPGCKLEALQRSARRKGLVNRLSTRLRLKDDFNRWATGLGYPQCSGEWGSGWA